MLDRSTTDSSKSFLTTIDHLQSLSNFNKPAENFTRRQYRTQRLDSLLSQLGNPEKKIPTIHIAGTNGKGSTAAIISSILSSANISTGLFTSPHLFSFTERIRLGLEPIKESDFTQVFEIIWQHAKEVPQRLNIPKKHGIPTTLEILTAMAFYYFLENGVKYQIIEAFVGGRHDLTNIVQPQISVITNISLDHTNSLGDTLPEIAYAKAGIIKPNTPVIIGPQLPIVTEVLVKEAIKQNAEITLIDSTSIRYKATKIPETQKFYFQGIHATYNCDLPLLGTFQQENTAIAITTIEILKNKDLPVYSRNILDGIKKIIWPCRFEVVQNFPAKVIVDGAHCPYSMHRVISELAKLKNYKSIIGVVGSTSGHNSMDTLVPLAQNVTQLITVKSLHPKAKSASELSYNLKIRGFESTTSNLSVNQTLKNILLKQNQKTLIIATGSLSVAAEVRKYFKRF